MSSKPWSRLETAAEVFGFCSKLVGVTGLQRELCADDECRTWLWCLVWTAIWFWLANETLTIDASAPVCYWFVFQKLVSFLCTFPVACSLNALWWLLKGKHSLKQYLHRYSPFVLYFPNYYYYKNHSSRKKGVMLENLQKFLFLCSEWKSQCVERLHVVVLLTVVCNNN